MEKATQGSSGSVDVGPQKYVGKRVYLSLRSLGDPAHYNVVIYETLPAGMEQGWLEPASATVFASGFAELVSVV